MKELILATNNENKIKEYRQILSEFGFNIKSQSEAGINIEVEETGTTFEENSRLKAQAIYDIKKTNVIADDSGLEVRALNNEPGVYSARYKGLSTARERNEYILNRLKEEKDRFARFVTTICYIDDTGHEELFKGIEILKQVIKLPIKVTIDKIDIINYPFNQIMMLDLNN